MEYQSMNLNIWEHLPNEIWEKVPKIYEKMDGWLGFGTGETNKGEEGIPYWFSFLEEEKHICVSLEPSGLSFFAYMEKSEWEAWKEKIKRVASEILDFEVIEPEDMTD
ncbi:hypothetical protein [Flammeovirga aprica]|uniref:Uncharacterized protein n=1 Tax=Flammeovirga aprica JL-4 TaxID=694437 RepID=A0A7X9XDF2_9BACT|nr:hypothetical protein [Flammeovirga aprica]NME72745.1 hypothetical protein [Flammeovirga aprica JL-4]